RRSPCFTSLREATWAWPSTGATSRPCIPSSCQLPFSSRGRRTNLSVDGGNCGDAGDSPARSEAEKLGLMLWQFIHVLCHFRQHRPHQGDEVGGHPLSSVEH